MSDAQKSREELLAEIQELRQQIEQRKSHEGVRSAGSENEISEESSARAVQARPDDAQELQQPREGVRGASQDPGAIEVKLPVSVGCSNNASTNRRRRRSGAE